MDWLESLHGVQESLRMNASLLETKSDAFASTGNYPMSDFLLATAEDLRINISIINDALNQKLHEDLKSANESTNNMLQAVLGIVANNDKACGCGSNEDNPCVCD